MIPDNPFNHIIDGLTDEQIIRSIVQGGRLEQWVRHLMAQRDMYKELYRKMKRERGDDEPVANPTLGSSETNQEGEYHEH